MWARVFRTSCVLIALALVPLACSTEDPRDQAGPVVEGFAKAWSSGQEKAVADAIQSSTETKQASEAMASFKKSLGITSTQVTPNGEVSCFDDDALKEAVKSLDPKPDAICRQQVAVLQQVEGLGPWAYHSSVEVHRTGEDAWRVHWTPQTLNPGLSANSVLRRSRTLPPRANILDRAGKPITTEKPVFRVGVEPRKVTAATYAQLADLVGVNTANLKKRVTAAAPTQLVDVIVLREAAYDNVKSRLDDVPGVVVREDKRSLGPSPSYARAIIGNVSLATAESLKNAGKLFEETDDVGSSGLQFAYQQQLAGKPGGSIQLFDKASDSLTGTLHEVRAEPGEPLQTTLDRAVQNAAEAVVGNQAKPTSIVAVQASTGQILAAANGPGITSYNRAFVGKYPPGSTFKTVSAAALLDAGMVEPTTAVNCPANITIGGFRFKNSHSFQLPVGTFQNAFAHSCNTTMVERAEQLDNDALPSMAARFGIGEKWDLGLPAFSGSVPEPRDLTDRAASMIGQSRVEMSALGMALVAGTVASGQPHKPTLLPKEKPGGAVGDPLPADLSKALQGMMRAVVTTGSAKQLNLPGVSVFAKTGTAEYGNEEPQRTHAWMIGFRGDLAFAVVIDDGGAGGADAGPVAKRFLELSPVIK
jgi:cell division protein FtsI/penicillin-binding protein 2